MDEAARTPRVRRGPVALALILVAALVGIGLLVFDGESPSHARIDRDEAEVARAPDPESPALTGTSPRAEPVEERVALDAADAEPEPVELGVEDPLALRGRVVDADGAGVAGAHVELLHGVLRSFNVLDLEANQAREVIASTITDRGGEFHVPLAAGLLVDVRATEPDDGSDALASATEPNRRAGQYVIVDLSASATVHGRVLRASDRTPVGGGTVRAFQRGSRSGLTWTATVAANGTFELIVTRDENVVVEVVPDDARISDWVPVVFDEDGRGHVEVLVADGFVATGRVVSAASGLPIAGATVGEGWTYRRSATTDAAGVYRMPGFGRPGSYELFAKAPGFGEAKRDQPPQPVDGVVNVDFELPPARAAFGRVVDAQGAPLADVYVAAIASEDGDEGQQTDWLSTRTDADGRFEIDRLTPHLRHALVLERRGYATCVYDFPEREFAPEPLDLGTFAMHEPAVVSGEVRASGGAPVANATVVLKGSNSDRGRLLERQTPRRSEPIAGWYSNSRSVRTDARGRFAFGDVAAGRYELYARTVDNVRSDDERVWITEGEIEDDVVLELPVAVTLTGRVLDSEGRPVVRAFVDPSLLEADDPEDLVGTQAYSAYDHTDDDGAFEVTGLIPGTYRLRVNAPRGADATPLLGATVDSVHTADEPIEIVLEPAAVIAGVVEGLPADGERRVVSGTSPDGTRHLAIVEEDGSFRFAVPHDAIVDLHLHDGRSTADAVLVTELGVAAGTSDVVVRVP